MDTCLKRHCVVACYIVQVLSECKQTGRDGAVFGYVSADMLQYKKEAPRVVQVSTDTSVAWTYMFLQTGSSAHQCKIVSVVVILHPITASYLHTLGGSKETRRSGPPVPEPRVAASSGAADMAGSWRQSPSLPPPNNRC